MVNNITFGSKNLNFKASQVTGITLSTLAFAGCFGPLRGEVFLCCGVVRDGRGYAWGVGVCGGRGGRGSRLMEADYCTKYTILFVTPRYIFR